MTVGAINRKDRRSALPAYDRERNSSSTKTDSHPQRRTTSRPSIYPRLISLLAGFIGTTSAALVGFGGTVVLFEGLHLWTIELAAVILVTRFVYLRLAGQRPVLADLGVRRRLSLVLAQELTLGITWLASCLLLAFPVSQVSGLTAFGANLVLQIGWYLAAGFILRWLESVMRVRPEVRRSKRVMVMGTGMRAQAQIDILLDTPEMDASVVGIIDFDSNRLWRYRDIPLVGSPDNLKEIVGGRQVDALFVAVEPEELAQIQSLLWTAEAMGIPVTIMPDLYPGWISQARLSHAGGHTCLVYRRVPESRSAILVKSLIDRVGAAVGLTLAAPVMLLCALLIKLESSGPVLFRQTRSGENGKPFRLIKFRTMCVDAERKKARLRERNEMSGPVFKIKEDPRVTRLGRILRKYSIDELPQLINVLRGEMSLVGPRPPIPHEVEGFQVWQRRKLSVKPGLTCLWQINGRNEVDFDEWMQLDLKYIDNWSLWEDARIIVKTIPAVLKGSGM